MSDTENWETFRLLPPQTPSSPSSGLSSITSEILEELILKIKQAKDNKSDVDSEGLEIKHKIDEYFQKENRNFLDPNENAGIINLKLSDVTFTRKAFEISITNFAKYKAIYAFAFFDIRKKITTMSKLVEKNKTINGNKKKSILSDIFVTEKCRFFKKDDRSGKFRILLCFAHKKDVENPERLDWFISESAFEVKDQTGKRSNESEADNDSAPKRSREIQEHEPLQLIPTMENMLMLQPIIPIHQSIIESSEELATTPRQLFSSPLSPPPPLTENLTEIVTQLKQEMQTLKQELEKIQQERQEEKTQIENLRLQIEEMKNSATTQIKNPETTHDHDFNFDEEPFY
ncbi:predicted protein [Naegleria gruberi]|uniref:Predicted protein n=1 Tax=Naegleria gruberi TaxID=5762 RepID=D2VYT0_NAEGR|nr:uncharacterized protein NAEGRDRAFT_74229 [Naegleria gruberi]EFC38011.1 predicted protein [Naegleria gruberi]|eukprot:XP_002670755.1 predicted protein [Naegleria gruberi strain NEG-M]